MMWASPTLDVIQAALPDASIVDHELAQGELTIEVPAESILVVMTALKTNEACAFEQLTDVTAVDYLTYGCGEWKTTAATGTGYERAVNPVSTDNPESSWQKPRFAVVYHLISVTHNHRIRVKAFVADDNPQIDSVVDIWSGANWYEREVFDLFGILFKSHPDLRRLLTDYGFVGHPFRKDFPLTGHVEVRYDAKAERVVYQPTSIEPRTLVPKVVRKDARYNEPGKPIEEGLANG